MRGNWIDGLLVGTVLLGAGAGLPGAEQRPLMRDFIGLNGHTVRFQPALYQPVARVVRGYHPVEWDLGSTPAEPPPFPQARNRVDWPRVYGSWRDQGWNVHLSLMFETVRRELWKDLEAEAHAYGKAFAREFGPSGTRRLIDSVEIGNEPGQWSDADFTRMHRAMARGLREGDPRLRIATCNLTTGPSGKYEKSVDCLNELLDLVDILTIHTYAQLEGWPTWKRSFPEDPRLERHLQDVSALCRWRDAHAPGKPVWITEFGYDSSTQPNEPSGNFARWQGVTDEQQAQWLVRSLLVFSALPVERAMIYYFDDEDRPAVHASSGITRRLQPKPAFHALAHLQRVLGGTRFTRTVVDEPGRLRVQEYRGSGAGAPTVWVAWSPTGEGKTHRVTLDGLPGALRRAEQMPLAAGEAAAVEEVREEKGTLALTVEESPVYLIFENR